jgi:hypothetical protein
MPHPLDPIMDKAYQNFLLKTMLGEISPLEVDSNDDINDFLTPTNISRSWPATLCKE